MLYDVRVILVEAIRNVRCFRDHSFSEFDCLVVTGRGSAIDLLDDLEEFAGGGAIIAGGHQFSPLVASVLTRDVPDLTIKHGYSGGVRVAFSDFISCFHFLGSFRRDGGNVDWDGLPLVVCICVSVCSLLSGSDITPLSFVLPTCIIVVSDPSVFSFSGLKKGVASSNVTFLEF